MSNVALFVAGTLVTLLVAAAMALLILGAVLDGRDEQARLTSEAAAAHDRTLNVVDDLQVVDAA